MLLHRQGWREESDIRKGVLIAFIRLLKACKRVGRPAGPFLFLLRTLTPAGESSGAAARDVRHHKINLKLVCPEVLKL